MNRKIIYKRHLKPTADAVCSGSDMCQQDVARLARETEGGVDAHDASPGSCVKQSCHFAIGSSCSVQGRSHGAHGSRRQQGAGLGMNLLHASCDKLF